MPNRVRVAPPVYVDNVPEVSCDADGILIRNQLGDTLHAWRMSRHNALRLVELIKRALSEFERTQGKNVTPFRKAKGERPPGHG